MTREQQAVLELTGVHPRWVTMELLKRAITRTNAGIQTEEIAQVNLARKLAESQRRLVLMRVRQIARQRELARHLAVQQSTNP